MIIKHRARRSYFMSLTWILPPCTGTPRFFVLCDILKIRIGALRSLWSQKIYLALSVQTNVYKYAYITVYILMYIRFLLSLMRRRDKGRNADLLRNSSSLLGKVPLDIFPRASMHVTWVHTNGGNMLCRMSLFARGLRRYVRLCG